MNADYERELEARIDRELQQLGDYPAPPALARRILRAVEQRAAAPWYRRPWSLWPATLQWASAGLAMATLIGLGLAAWALEPAEVGRAGAQQLAGQFSGLSVLWRTVSVLGEAANMVVQHFGPWFVAGAVAALAIAYVACVGLGTVYVRLALARR